MEALRWIELSGEDRVLLREQLGIHSHTPVDALVNSVLILLKRIIILENKNK